MDIEKIEINKGLERSFYTGALIDDGSGWIQILTVRGEDFKFQKNQVKLRRKLREDEINVLRGNPQSAQMIDELRAR